MKSKEFTKLLRTHSPETILAKYMKAEIYLNNRQLDKVIEKKKGTPEEGRGAIAFGGARWAQL